VIALAGGFVLVAVAAACGAVLLRVRGAVGVVLATAVLGCAEVVAVSHLLSPFDAYTRGRFLVVVALVAAAAASAVALIRPPRPRLGHVPPVARELIRDPAVAVLAAVVVAEVVYLLALALFTPPTEYDVLTYHLTRAILWIQQHSVSPVAGVEDSRINDLPPDAEILQGATMLLSGSVRYVGLVQLGSLVAAVLGVYGTASRIGLERRQAAFGALVFPTLTVVALQAPSALNDLLAAALVIVTAYFVLGRSPSEMALAAVALALLVGTKPTAVLVVPILFVVCLLTYRGRRLVAALASGVAALAIGGLWYAVGGGATADEGLGTAGDSAGAGDILRVAARATRYLVETIDVPAGGRDLYVYAIVAAGLVALGLALRWSVPVAFAAGALALVPLAFPFVERVLHAVYWHGWTLVGYPEATTLDPTRGASSASSMASWYGPVGLALTLVSLVVATRCVVRRTLPPVAAVLAWSPVVVLLGSAVIVGYHAFDGRYVMGGVALGATTWGMVRFSRAATAAATAVAATSLFLALVNFDARPAGFGLFNPPVHPSIWTLPRPWSQSVQPEVSRIIEHLDAHSRPGETIAVTRNQSVYPFVYVGWPTIAHRIVYADSLEEATRGNASWAVVASGVACAPGWELALASEQWALYRHVSRARCR
jgi:hypothetical protein